MPRFELKGKVQLDGNQWQAGLNQAKRSADKWSSETAGMISSRLKQAFAVGAMWRTATQVLDKAKVISRDASKLDVSPEMFQHLEYAAQRSKVEIDDVREAILELSVKQQEMAKGSKDVTEAFQRFGLEFDDVVNEKPLELFKKIEAAIASGINPQNMIADLDTILSDDGKKLITAFTGGFMNKVSESQEIGAPLSNQQIQEMNQTSTALSEAQQSIGVAIGKAYSDLSKLVENYGALVTLPFSPEFAKSNRSIHRLQEKLDNKILEKIEKNTRETANTFK
jgi:uncharacterized protein YukE